MRKKRRMGFTPLEKVYRGRDKGSKQSRFSEDEKGSLTGFTLVEIMVVVGIIGLILSMAIPNFINARKKTRAKVCVNNLHQIHGAKQQWALDNDKAESEVPTSVHLSCYLEEWPSCPSDGTYEIKRIDTVPTCSIGTTPAETWAHHVF